MMLDRPEYGGFRPQQDHTLLTENSVLRGRIDGLEQRFCHARCLFSSLSSTLRGPRDRTAAAAGVAWVEQTMKKLIILAVLAFAMAAGSVAMTTFGAPQ